MVLKTSANLWDVLNLGNEAQKLENYFFFFSPNEALKNASALAHQSLRVSCQVKPKMEGGFLKNEFIKIM